MNPLNNSLPAEKIKEILNKIPDEKINRDTTGRSNLQFISLIGDSSTLSCDRIPDAANFSFANKKKKKQPEINQSNIPEKFYDQIENLSNPIQNNPNNQTNIGISQNNQQITNDDNLSNELMKIGNEILISAIDSMNSGFILCLASYLFFELWFPLWILFTVFVLVVTFHLVRNFYYYSQMNEDEFNIKNKMISELLDEMLLLLLMVSFFLYIEYQWFSLIYIALPVPILDLCVWYALNFKESKSYLYTSITIRVFLFIQLLHLALKIDNLIHWEWKMVFWASWLCFVLIGLYIFGIIILILYSSFQIVSGRKNGFQVYGLVWCLNILLILDTNVFLLSFGLIDYFSYQDSGKLRLNFMLMVLWLPAFEILTFFFSKPLISFIVSINEEGIPHEFEEMENSDFFPNHQQPQFLEIKAKNKSKQIIIERKTSLQQNVPQFLVKFSATYFQVADFKKELMFGIFKHLPKSKNSQKLKIKNPKKTPRKQKENQQIGEFSNNELVELQNKTSNFKKTMQNKKKYEDKVNKTEEFKETNSFSASLNETIKTESDKSIKTCVICYDKVPDAVLMECGHGGICYECAVNLWKKSQGECHLCRKPILKILQIETNPHSKILLPVLAVIEKREEI